MSLQHPAEGIKSLHRAGCLIFLALVSCGLRVLLLKEQVLCCALCEGRQAVQLATWPKCGHRSSGGTAVRSLCRTGERRRAHAQSTPSMQPHAERGVTHIKSQGMEQLQCMPIMLRLCAHSLQICRVGCTQHTHPRRLLHVMRQLAD